MIKDCNQNNINTIKDPLKRKNEASNYLRNYIELLITLQQIILNLTEENLEISVEKTMNIFDLNFPYSFNLVISNLIYFSFYSKRNEINIYLQYVKIIQVKEEEISKDYPKILEIFIKYISDIKSQEAYYLIEQMIERNLIHENITKHISSKYFAQYKTEIENKNSEYIDPIERSFVNSYDELAQNDFELHKRYVQEGVNPNEIAKIIRNDNVEKLQEISSQTKFNFKQTIEPSLYERYSFINQEYIPLIDYAAFFGSIKCFRYLLLNKSKIKETGKYAVAGGNLEIVHICEQNHSSFKGAYYTAITFHQNEIFKYIYENKFEKFQNSSNSGTRLSFNVTLNRQQANVQMKPKNINDLKYFCVISDNYEILSFLEKEEMKIDEMIIYEAAKLGNLYLIKHFLQNNKMPKFTLIFSSASGNIELVKYIIEQGKININEKDEYKQTALMIASEKGYPEIVELLLRQKRIDINAINNFGQTALMIASQNNHEKVIKLLLGLKRIDFNKKDILGNTALMIAAENGNNSIAKLLLEKKGIDFNDKNNDEETALMLACENGNTILVKMLLEKEGIDINDRDKNKRTLLLIAVLNNYIEIVKLLLKHKEININDKAKYGETSLMLACDNGNYIIVKELLKRDDIIFNEKGKNGKTALMIATAKGYTNIVKLLLEQEGIDINAKNKYPGWTALMIASANGFTEIVKLLLEQKGIDINIRDDKGNTAFILACEKNYNEIVQLFLENAST